jgi:hypothetical protein
MAATALRIKSEIPDVYQRILITSAKGPEDITMMVTVTHCTNDWFPAGPPFHYERTESEEAFHTDLRAISAEKKQLITQFSTNPEWNPEGYKLKDNQYVPKEIDQEEEKKNNN